ncbi:AAA family ATPase [Desulforamulus ruminis]|uniref:Helix-turn-helix domain protein n=1 Tax=Desulforamulus ruminis (strain ATCC 23193 / DSM 2154 / NCIMB 8452 / DL) TaxID=696281 RepID=F6DTI0_DESRL|nr:AAA family ATPase [Desulforamulus ruminis]AEG60042.1 helix-turn-helix domain protein [Desulforamulus ruminis DSM 2154]
MSTATATVLAATWSKARTILNSLVKDEGTKVTDVAKALGKSHSTISLYINGKYPSNDKFEELVEGYLKSLGKWVEDQEEENVPESGYIVDISELGTIITDDYQRVRGVCRKSQERKEFGIVVGDPGAGKTRALEDYAKENQGVVMITCDETSSIKSVLTEITEGLHLEARGASATLLNKIVKELKRRPRLLIVDEADKVKLKVLETLRGIYDKAKNIGVVLCGNQPLAEKIILLAEDRPELARLRDRLGYYITTNGLTEPEAAKFLERVNLTASARKMMIDVAVNRGIRQLVKSLDRLLEVTAGERITDSMVTDVGRIYLGFNA